MSILKMTNLQNIFLEILHTFEFLVWQVTALCGVISLLETCWLHIKNLGYV